MRSPSLWARVLLCLAGTALMPVSAADKLINPKAEEKPISGTGTGVEVTPLQLATLGAALANGGVLVRPFTHAPSTPRRRSTRG